MRDARCALRWHRWGLLEGDNHTSAVKHCARCGKTKEFGSGHPDPTWDNYNRDMDYLNRYGGRGGEGSREDRGGQ